MHWLYASVGGMMIGAAGSLLLLTHGRVAGISGILGGLVRREASARGWRLAFMLGLIGSGIIAAIVAPASISLQTRSAPMLVVAGVLVGYGTQLGGGCTSGHGVCGISRWSTRSLVAVATFMTTAVLAAMIAGRVS